MFLRSGARRESTQAYKLRIKDPFTDIPNILILEISEKYTCEGMDLLVTQGMKFRLIVINYSNKLSNNNK